MTCSRKVRKRPITKRQRAFNAGWDAALKAQRISTEDMWAPDVVNNEFRDVEFRKFITQGAPHGMR